MVKPLRDGANLSPGVIAPSHQAIRGAIDRPSVNKGRTELAGAPGAAHQDDDGLSGDGNCEHLLPVAYGQFL